MHSREVISESQIDTLTFPGTPPEPEESTVEAVTKKERYYIDKKQLTQALRDWKAQIAEAEANGTEPPRVSEYIGKCILDIAKNMSNKFNFRGYSFKDDMVGDACINALTYLHNFNPDAPTRSGEPNPFWYISLTCHNTFTKCIEREARQQYYKYKAFELLGSMSDMLGDEDLSDLQESGNASIQEMYNDFNSKVSTYEAKHLKKSKGRKKKTTDEPVQEPGGLLEFLE